MIKINQPATTLFYTAIAAGLLAFGNLSYAKQKPDYFGLPKTPEEFFPIMAARFNSLDVEAALALFNEDSVMVDGEGNLHRGIIAIRSELQRYFGTGLQLKLTPRHVYYSGDTALSINDWAYDGIAKDGKQIKMSGRTSDVLRRGQDGVWRYAIDNPFGTRDNK